MTPWRSRECGSRLGQGALGAGVADVSAGGTVDLVVLDDFLFGEPQPAQ